MAHLWAELEEKPLPVWAQRQITVPNRPVLQRNIGRTTPFWSFVSSAETQMQSRVVQLHSWWVQYANYCLLRQRFMQNHILI